MEHQEIECRFLEIDKAALLKKLAELGAKDLGEKTLEETIMYDIEGKWREHERFIRLRKIGDKTKLSLKEHREHTVDGTYEIELEVSDYAKAELLFEKIGLKAYRHQEKKRHTLELDGVIFDIDTWPRIPTYVELEGRSEEALRRAALLVGYDWEKANFHNAAWVIENEYHIPVKSLKYFTFDKVE